MADTGAGSSQERRQLNEEQLKAKRESDRRRAKTVSHSVELSTDGDNYWIVNDSKTSQNWPSGM